MAGKAREVFEKAAALTGVEREVYLREACGADASLRGEVDSLLRASEHGAAFLACPTAALSGDAGEAETLVTPVREGPGTRIGPYKILQLIGEGGFGSVFMAEQERPVARKVALKVIKLGMDTRQVVARFEQERQALAILDHPNIAKVFDAGATETGRPFFVMELCTGEPIDSYCDRNRLSIQERLELFAQVCQAVQHAHTKGLIHRDIKPSNVLVSMQDGRAHAKVIDFGIAKATASKLTEKTLFTEHKALIGTPEYMSPEQAEGSLDIDTRTDVYALGVLLYELLTGTTPFSSKELRSAAYAEIQRIIREVEPPNPSTRLSHNTEALASVAASRQTEPRKLGTIIRGELDWIVMKALEKDRTRRYETANGLAMDVRRYLAGEAVLAAPPSAVYRYRKFVKRHRPQVAAAGLVMAALLVGLAGTLWQAWRASERAEAAEKAEQTARSAESEQRRLAVAEAAARREADEKRLLADAKTRETEAALKIIEHNSYVANMQLAGQAMELRQFDRVRQSLDACPERLRAWEWGWLDASADNSLLAFKGHTGKVRYAAFSRDGTRIATASWDHTARVWDAATGASLAELKGHTGMVMFAAFSPDGTRIVTVSEDKTARVWDAATGASVAELKGHTDMVLSAAFSPDGTCIVTASQDFTARVWNAATGASLAALKGHTHHVRTAVFSPDGTRIVTASLDRTARLWDAKTGASLAELKGHVSQLRSAVFSPDGTRIVTAAFDGIPRVWDAATGASLTELKGHTGGISSAAFSTDGTRIVTTSSDKTGRVWDAATGASLAEFKGHTDHVNGAVFSPDGTQIVTTSEDKTARVWNAATGASLAELKGHTDYVASAVFSPDGTRIVTASGDHTARLWSAATGAIKPELLGHTNAVVSVAFSPDGARFITASADKTVRVWDTTTGESLAEFTGHTNIVESAVFSPDGARIATASDDKTARVWDAATGESVAELKGHTDVVRSAAFSPGGAKIVTASWDKTARVWDAATGARLSEFKGHTDHVLSATFSPDGTRIVTASTDKSARVWNAATGATIAELLGHTSVVMSASFSPDGTRIVTAAGDKIARIWDAATGVNLIELKGHTAGLCFAAFSPDGTRIVTGSTDKTARVWDATTGESLTELKGQINWVYCAAFSPDGARIVTASLDASVRMWDSVPFRDRFSALQRAQQIAAKVSPDINKRLASGESPDQVRAAIRADSAFTPEERSASYAVVQGFSDRRRDEQFAAYRQTATKALADARRALELDPASADRTFALGVALYRGGGYEESLATLFKAEDLYAKLPDESRRGPQPADWAFIAMCRHKLRDLGNARAALARCRELMKDAKHKDNGEAQAFLREAADLIENAGAAKK